MTRRIAGGLLALVLSFMAVGLAWEGYLALFDVNEFFGKGPGDVWTYLFSDVEAPANRSELLEGLGTTMRDAAVGYLGGTLAAVVVAVGFVLSRTLERAVLPIALALRSVPIVAMIPLLAVVFGRDLLGTIVIVGIIVWFPTLVLVTHGLRSVTPQAFDLMAAYDASPWTTLRKVRLPGALPSLFASAKIAAPAAILGALLNEWLSTGEGLGNLLVLSTTTSNYTRLWAGVVIITLVSIVLYAVVNTIEGVVTSRLFPDRTL